PIRRIGLGRRDLGNQAIGHNPDKEVEVATVEQSIEVHVPVRTAYDQWTQFEEFPQFMEAVKEVRQLDDTHLHWRISHDGQEAEFDATITEQKPDDRIAWTTTAGKAHA